MSIDSAKQSVPEPARQQADLTYPDVQVYDEQAKALYATRHSMPTS